MTTLDGHTDTFDSTVAQLCGQPGSISLPVMISRTYRKSMSDIGGKPGQLEVAVDVSGEVRLRSTVGAEFLGVVECRDSRSGVSLEAEYILVADTTPKLFRRRSGTDPDGWPVDHFDMANRIADRAAAELDAYLSTLTDRSEKALGEAAADFVREEVVRGLKHSAFLVGKINAPAFPVSLADVPFYQISKDDGGVRCDVVDTREPDSETVGWKAGLQFEPWEAQVAHDVAQAYGASGFLPRGLEAFVDHASDLAVVSRMEMNSLVRQFIKAAMLDVSAFKHSEEANEAARVIYHRVNCNEWSAPDLDRALAVLDGIWMQDKRMWTFAESRGWDAPISPFAVMADRVTSFPWRRVTPAQPSRAASSPSP